MRLLHIIREVTNGGATLGLLRQCTDGPKGISHIVASLRPPSVSAARTFVDAGVDVIWRTSDVINATEDADGVQVEWWNNPEVNTYLVLTDLPPCRLLLHARGHFDAPWMCPSSGLLSRVDLCSVTTPGAALNPAFDLARVAAGLPVAPCIFSAAALPPRRISLRPERPPVFGYLGTVEPIKMHRGAVTMAAEVLRAIPEGRFIFAGDGPLESYRSQANALGVSDRIKFTGFTANTAEFLAGLDIFFYPLNPFTYATSEKALQEAMACGLPCVVFPHGGVRDLVTNTCAAVARSTAEFVDLTIALARDPDYRTALGEAASRHLMTLPHVNFWRTLAANTWASLLNRPKQARRALHDCEASLFEFATAVDAYRPDQLSHEARAEFDCVAAFVLDAYAEFSCPIPSRLE